MSGHREPRDARALVGLGLAFALAWSYLLYLAWGMEHMDAGMQMAIMPRMTGWQTIDLLLVFSMWSVMMVAMMLPSATPMILTLGALDRHRHGRTRLVRVAAFVGGYIVTWSAFSLALTLLQWGLLEARLVSPMMRSNSPLLGGVLLIAAGAFQFTALKQTCLATCSSPLSFIMSQWRAGNRGALVMGIKHGVYCVGCCWLLMVLLFVFGVMNLAWIVALMAFVFVEKALPRLPWLSAAAGAALMGWGALMLYGG